MFNEQLKQIEGRLLGDRVRSLQTIEVLKARADDASQAASGELSGYPLHPADLGTEAHERQQALALADQEGRHFAFIEDALQRLYGAPEEFGRCQACGREIQFERLLEVPHTRYCLDCKTQVEREEIS